MDTEMKCKTIIDPDTLRFQGYNGATGLAMVVVLALTGIVMHVFLRLTREDKGGFSVNRARSLNYLTKGTLMLVELILTVVISPTMTKMAMEGTFCPTALDMWLIGALAMLVMAEYLSDLLFQGVLANGVSYFTLVHHLPCLILFPVIYLIQIPYAAANVLGVAAVLLYIISIQHSILCMHALLLSGYVSGLYYDRTTCKCATHTRLYIQYWWKRNGKMEEHKPLLKRMFLCAGIFGYIKTVIIFGLWVGAYISMAFVQKRVSLDQYGAEILILTPIMSFFWFLLQLYDAHVYTSISRGNTLKSNDGKSINIKRVESVV